jgi:hypothetical protein
MVMMPEWYGITDALPARIYLFIAFMDGFAQVTFHYLPNIFHKT